MNLIWRSTVLLALAIQLAGHTQEILPSRASNPIVAEAVWQGRVTSTLDYGDYQEVLTGGVKFEYVSTNGIEDHYKITGGSLTWSASGSDENCIYSGGPTVHSLSETNTDGEMIVFSNGRYTINNWMTTYPPGIITAVCDPGGSNDFPGQNASIVSAPFIPPFYYLGDAGTSMKGTYTLGFSEWTWDLTSKPPELEIEIVGYDNWMPDAGADETTPGKDLSVHARVVNEDGTPLDRPADKFRFEFTKASKEPGITLNYPKPEKAIDDFDLQFLKERNPDAEKNDEDFMQWIEMPPALESDGTLTSFDWGAFGTLKVTAMVDGFEVVGYLKGDKNKKEFLIPKRKEDSNIADAWKSKNDATALADDDDSDNKPEGDGHTGDGYTLYEEYRGFMENGKHINGKPTEKDFFIWDDLGGRSKQGIGLFISATKLNVHHELTEDEFPNNRNINANYGEGAHKGGQTGIWLTKGTSQDWSFANGGPGLPRQIFDVTMAKGVLNSPDRMIRIRSGGKTVRVDQYAEIFTHELGHTVNIWHHGDIDWQVKWGLNKNPDGSYVRYADSTFVVYEDGSNAIAVYYENRQRVATTWLQGINPVDIWLGVIGGQHSGDELCFMRYDVANAFYWTEATRGIFRYGRYGNEDPPASRFCRSPVGTGQNAPNRPVIRFGNASSAATEGPSQRGNCLGRICVNDSQPDH